MTLAHEFGDNLREARRSKRLSQEVLAARALLSRDTVHKIENGNRLPRIDTLLRLAEGLEVEAGDLLRGLRP